MNQFKLKIIQSTVSGYDKIALKFHNTRLSFFGDLKFVKKYVKQGSKILDFGCGNGRLAGFLADKDCQYLGLDVSKKLIEIAKENHSGKNTAFLKIDPFSKLETLYGSFDLVFSIAVFHHFPDYEYRLKRALELQKTLKKDGLIVVSVWNLWQKKYFLEILKEMLRKISGKSKVGFCDVFISFKENDFSFQRYHHAFTLFELKRLFKKAGFVELESLNTGKNLVFIGKKK